MKVLFLDHQGVMRTEANPKPGTLVDFNKDCVKTLNQILAADKKIQIVISSDWKEWVYFSEMQHFYNAQGVSKLPSAYVPKQKRLHNNPAEQRAMEINTWLSYNPKVTHWAAVDDLDMMKYLTNFVYISEPDVGLCQQGTFEELMKFYQ